MSYYPREYYHMHPWASYYPPPYPYFTQFDYALYPTQYCAERQNIFSDQYYRGSQERENKDGMKLKDDSKDGLDGYFQQKIDQDEENQKNHSISRNLFKQKQANINQNLKRKKLDKNYREKTKKIDKIVQKQGRNKNSNIFKAFLKVILSFGYRNKLKEDFQRIKITNNFKIKFEDFFQYLQQKTPNYNNYINMKQFRFHYFGSSEVNKLFRILFQLFRKHDGYTYLLTIGYKGRIKEKGRREFFQALRQIEALETKQKQESQ